MVTDMVIIIMVMHGELQKRNGSAGVNADVSDQAFM